MIYYYYLDYFYVRFLIKRRGRDKNLNKGLSQVERTPLKGQNNHSFLWRYSFIIQDDTLL